MNRNVDDTIKEITLSIIQFDTDIKAGEPEGINKFLNIIDTYKSYFSLRVPDMYYEKTQKFKEEIRDVFTDLFVNHKIYEVAESLFINNGVIKMMGTIPIIEDTLLTQKIGKISMELNILVYKYENSRIGSERNPLYNLSDEEFTDILVKKEAGIRIFKEFDTNPFKEFVLKYQDRYNEPIKKYPDKYYAWYHKILIAKGKAEQFIPGAKQEIIDYGKERYRTKGTGFYIAYMNFDLTGPNRFVNSLSQKERKIWKKKIIEISDNDIDVINYLKNFPN